MCMYIYLIQQHDRQKNNIIRDFVFISTQSKQVLQKEVELFLHGTAWVLIVIRVALLLVLAVIIVIIIVVVVKKKRKNLLA